MAKGSKARLFFALDLPAEARAEIVAWRGSLGGTRLVGEESLHVTLLFLGWLPEDEVPRIATRAREAVDGHSAVALEPVGLRGVPPRAPRLFALDLEDRGGRCSALHASLGPGEDRPFWPHVTLARVKRGSKVEAPPVEGLPGPFVADRVVLYRSHLSSQGARYEALWATTLEA